MDLRVMPTIASGLFLVACAGMPANEQERAALEAEIAARQGTEVDRICFVRNIDGWRPLGDEALLLEKGVDDWYMVELTGTCEPEWAFDAIAIRTRPGAALCLTRGDSIATFDAPLEGTCFISHIYEWDDEARVADVGGD